MSRARVAYYGDDFTGSVDVLLQFARHGWTGRLFAGLPDPDALALAAAECDVVGVAGIARSLPTAALDAEVRPALAALAALEPDVLQYKACSTADSSPDIGSLGRVLEIGREVVGSQTVPLLFAQPDFGRYTAFGHHFAAEGGVVHRLDRQPTMSRHPSTPMTESDLALHLARQTDLAIGGVPFTAYRDGAALARRIAEAEEAALVLDALDDAHLALVGAAVAELPGPVFAVGSGGLSAAIAGSAAGSGAALPRATASGGAPVLAVSGSRSPRSRRQADAAARAGWEVAPLVEDPGAGQADAVVAALAAGRSVALTSDDAAFAPGGTPVLERIAGAAAAVVAAVAQAGAVRRVIVCGGDTSSRVTRLLGVESLSIAANPWGNVALCAAHAPDPAIDGLELLLKGGQVGDDELFESIRTLDV